MHAETPVAVTRLSSLSRGQEATVTEIRGSTPLVTRLREFGCLRGTAVRVLRGGGTLMLQLGELRLCMRRRDAEAILVSPVLAAAASTLEPALGQ